MEKLLNRLATLEKNRNDMNKFIQTLEEDKTVVEQEIKLIYQELSKQAQALSNVNSNQAVNNIPNAKMGTENLFSKDNEVDKDYRLDNAAFLLNFLDNVQNNSIVVVKTPYSKK